MPATLTYASLVADMQAYSERQDAAFVAQIPRLINLAENRIAAEAHILGYLIPLTGQLVIGQYAVAKPLYWHQTVSFNLTDATGNIVPVLPRTYEYIRNYWPNSSQRAVPRYYADYNFDNWLIGPSSDAAYNYEVLSYVRLQPLDATTSTNWLTLNAPHLLLAAAMLEAQLWCKNWDKVAYWQAVYDRALSAFTAEDGARDADRNILLRPNAPAAG